MRGGGGAVHFRPIQSVGCPLSLFRPYYILISHAVQVENDAWTFYFIYFIICALNIGPAAAGPAVPVPPPLG